MDTKWLFTIIESYLFPSLSVGHTNSFCWVVFNIKFNLLHVLCNGNYFKVVNPSQDWHMEWTYFVIKQLKKQQQQKRLLKLYQHNWPNNLRKIKWMWIKPHCFVCPNYNHLVFLKFILGTCHIYKIHSKVYCCHTSKLGNELPWKLRMFVKYADGVPCIVGNLTISRERKHIHITILPNKVHQPENIYNQAIWTSVILVLYLASSTF